MKLFIHYGIYKTGSSYLQHCCAINKAHLIGHGIYFPDSPNDRLMKDGQISSGNAVNLETYLKKKDGGKCSALFSRWKAAAQAHTCHSILISAEALVHQLATPEGLETLEKAVRKSGIGEVHLLGFFRDLADHAISTYKHRGKSGRYPDFEHWIKNYYETPKVLDNLFQLYPDTNFIWTFRKFKKDPKHMLTAFFQDWLKIQIPELKGNPSVNTSLTLSEVLIMNEVARHYGLVTDYFINAFKSIPKELKGNDSNLENWYFSKACFHLREHDDLVDQINENFREVEKLEVGKNLKAHLNINKNTAFFTETQIKALFNAIGFFNKISGKVLLLRRRVAKILPQKIVKKLIGKRLV